MIDGGTRSPAHSGDRIRGKPQSAGAPGIRSCVMAVAGPRFLPHSGAFAADLKLCGLLRRGSFDGPDRRKSCVRAAESCAIWPA